MTKDQELLTLDGWKLRNVEIDRTRGSPFGCSGQKNSKKTVKQKLKKLKKKFQPKKNKKNILATHYFYSGVPNKRGALITV